MENPLNVFAHIGDDVKQFVQRQIDIANVKLEIKIYQEARQLADARLVALNSQLSTLQGK